MERVSISPNKAKVFSSLTITTIMSVFLLISLGKVMRSTSERTMEQYIESCQNVATSYAYALNSTIDNYRTLLNCYYIPEQYENASSLEIQKILQGLSEFGKKATPDFTDVFYVDREGICYTQNGACYPVTDRDYYYAIFVNNLDFYINAPVRSKLDGEPVIILAIPVKPSGNETTGILCALIKLSTFSSIFTNSSLNEMGQIAVLDRRGRFIIHQDKNWLYKTFDPSEYGIEDMNSKSVVELEKGNYETVNVKGNPIRLFCQKVTSADWTLCLTISKDRETEYRKNYQNDIIFVLICALISIAILVVLEYIIMNIFQKHQFIAAIFDPLTNLWTRQHFEYEATKWLHRSPRSKFMLIECDIRGFKFINQNYGELSANKMLLRFSKMLSRTTEQYRGIIGRGFADRFYILYKISSVHKAMNLFKSQLPVFNDEIKDFDLPFFPKFGIAFLMPENNRRTVTIQGLIGQASFAKTTIKDNMMVQYAIYNSRLIKKINEEQFIEQHMTQALENNEFFVMYQPKMSLNDDKIVGAEALVRWNSPELGLLSPDKFIPLFERNGFITTLDFYVYEQVFKFMEKMIAEGKTIVPVSVNMSRNHSKPDRFMHQFLEIYKKYDIPPNLIQIEILERSFMNNSTLSEITNNLHKEGFTVAMDDFGSGESSLNMLTKIPVDVLKFDRDFLQSSTNEEGKIDQKSAGFIEILIELSKQLNKETVFEGVETVEQRDFLKSIQCDQAQGFFYSRPLVQEDFIKFIELHK